MIVSLTLFIQFIFISTILCFTKKVCDYYKDHDRHAEFFKKYKDNEELLSYIADILTNEYRNNRCEI